MMPDEFFALGACFGLVVGKDRVGVYVDGEEWPLSIDAAKEPPALNERQREAWAAGYRAGYRLGASGEALPRE